MDSSKEWRWVDIFVWLVNQLFDSTSFYWLKMTMTPHIMHWRAAHTASLDISALEICKGMGNQRNPSHKTLPNITVMPFPMPNMKKNTLDKATYDVYVVVSRSSWKKWIGWISSKMVHAEHEKKQSKVETGSTHSMIFYVRPAPPPPFCINLLTCKHLKNWTDMTVLTLLRHNQRFNDICTWSSKHQGWTKNLK